MNPIAKSVLVIGGGAAGLTAALELAHRKTTVELVEKSCFAGGHAVQFACKAASRCVKCGACAVEEKLKAVVENPNIKLVTASRITEITGNGPFTVTVEQDARCIDPEKCTGCGICLNRCPEAGAIIKSTSAMHRPPYAIWKEACRFFKDRSCSLCQEACPESAITLDLLESSYASSADAVVVACGFKPFDPQEKPYGYKTFPNVITNLELDQMLRREGICLRPSDQSAPARIGFVQCVGSRDAKLQHLWCSKVCCGSALRAANLIRTRQPETQSTVFYIDIQTFGKDFDSFYADIRGQIRLIRSIPADIFQNEDKSLKVTYFDPQTNTSREENFDLVVLSIGITPAADIAQIARMLDAELAATGFLADAGAGIFPTGTTIGPMSIAEAMAHAGKTAWDVLRYLER